MFTFVFTDFFFHLDDIKFTRTFGVKIAKAEGNYHSDLLEPLSVHDENSKSHTRYYSINTIFNQLTFHYSNRFESKSYSLRFKAIQIPP